LGNDDERVRSERLAAGESAARVPPRQPIDALAALIARAELVVGVDTGLVHLAAASARQPCRFSSPPTRSSPASSVRVAMRAISEASADPVRRCRSRCGRRAVAPRAELLSNAAMRALYTLLGYLVLPLLPLRLWWRARREPGYREHIGERFGRYRNADRAPREPSCGCTRFRSARPRAAVPLVDRLRARYPDAAVLVTHMTATGRAAGRRCSAIAWSRRGYHMTFRSPYAAFSRMEAAHIADHGDRAVAEHDCARARSWHSRSSW
jgi:hypothetical protein